MDHYTASCAVCGGPGDPECPCEGERLKICVDTAERRWIESWITKTQEWVINNAIHHITSTFAQLKRARLVAFAAHLNQLPNYAFFLQCHGRPPLHPEVLYHLHRQIADAKADLRRDIDQDWKACVLRYPEVLAHFYSLVNVALPREFDPPVLTGLGASVPPPAPAPPPPPQPAAAAPVAFAMMGMGGGPGVGVPLEPMARPQLSRATSQTKKSNLAPRRMSMDREKRMDREELLYPKGEKKKPPAPTPGPGTGTRPQTKRRNSGQYTILSGHGSMGAVPAPPGAPMPPVYYRAS